MSIEICKVQVSSRTTGGSNNASQRAGESSVLWGAVKTMYVIGVLGDIEGKTYTRVHLLEENTA